MTARHAGLSERLFDRLAGSDGWRSPRTGSTPGQRPPMESLFAVGNGSLGTRGTPGEADPHTARARSSADSTRPIEYPEDAFRLARTGQTIVRATDGLVIRLFVDDEPFVLATARVVRSSACSTCGPACFAARSSSPSAVGGQGLVVEDRCEPLRLNLETTVVQASAGTAEVGAGSGAAPGRIDRTKARPEQAFA
jgi:hypothetical protein